MKKLILIGVLFLAIMVPYNSVHANTYWSAVSNAVNQIVDSHKDVSDSDKSAEPEIKPVVPAKEIKIEIKKKLWVTATAYSSTPWQTDDSPFITATGYDVRNKTKNIIAVSRDLVRSLGYHRQVRLPSLYGSEVFYIEDTMNARYVNRIDVHHESTEEARNFGVKKVEMEVI
jgi:3D (Asp-Asp-Asp) domain-containing protein